MRHAKKRRPLSWMLVVLTTIIGLTLVVVGGVTLKDHHRKIDPLVELSPSAPPTLTISSPPVVMPTRPSGCDAWPDTAHAPTAVGIAGVGLREIESLPRIRDAAGNISSPDPTNYNPSVFAWDNESAKPGEAKGRVLFTAHTYHADSSALGNRLIAMLGLGDLIRVKSAGTTLCYRVVERLQVPVEKYPAAQIYGSDAEGLAITVCSGYDGHEWTQRTVWFASPVK